MVFKYQERSGTFLKIDGRIVRSVVAAARARQRHDDRAGALARWPETSGRGVMLLLLWSIVSAAYAQGEFPVQAPALQAAPADSMLGVEAANGSATVEHLGIRKTLQAGDRLGERDLVRTGDDGHLALRFARLGLIEVGPGAEIGIEKLPIASDAKDMKSIFSLTRGYLRVVWKHPATGASWPLYVYFGGQRAGVGPGEYFFDQRRGSTRVCVASGQIAVVPVTGGGIDSLPPGTCSLLFAEEAPETQPSPPEGWIAMRRDFSIDATDAPGGSPIAQLGAQRQIEDRSFSAQPSVRPPPKPIVPIATSTPESAPAVAAATSPPTAAATPPPPPPPPPPLVPPGDGSYAVNIGSYPEKETANRNAQQLRTAGYSASVQPAQIGGRPWYRVQLRGFSTAEEARSKADELQTKLGYTNLWVVRP